MTMTPVISFFDSILDALQKAPDYNRDDTVPPAAVLWPDEKREWEPLVPRLKGALPQVVVFGAYDAAQRTGPAIWLRCVLAGTIAEASLPVGIVPIVYLPGVSRAIFRDPEGCPAEFKALFELQYRGVIWSQANAKDWTIAAFLQAERGGLHLTVAKDQGTATALRRALEKLADTPLADLQAKSAAGELNAGYFDSLMSDDLVDDLLSWMSQPQATRSKWEPGRWETLCSRCLADYGFDPARDGELAGAELLGQQEKPAWKAAWKRYAAAPSRYPGLVELLRRAKPESKGKSLFDAVRAEPWPQDNEAAESELRQALLRLKADPVGTARQTLITLESNHRHRRDWVWAPLQRAPLARAILHLAILAETTQAPLAGATTAGLVRAYVEGGWRADAAVLDSLADLSHPQDQEAVSAAIAHVYTPWLRDAAELFQNLVKHQPLPGRELARLATVPGGTCVLFADGLRYDVGQKLEAALAGLVGDVVLSHHFAALPSVTPTAKPAVSPVAALIAGTTAGEEFRPSVGQAFQPDAGPAGQPRELTIDRFRRLLEHEGFQVLGPKDVGDPNGRGWAEFGNLDATGHQEGIGLARRIPELLVALTRRIEFLLEAGWREVRVVTDHGWLLLPGGLPKTDLPKFLTQTRWGRCAVVKPNATVDLPKFGWHWSDHVTVACPTGISSFLAGQEYNHGGLSLQECVVPQFSIRAGKQLLTPAKIETVKWAGLRCRVKVTGAFQGCRIDLRDKAADAATSLAEARPVGDDGAAAVVVADDSREGSATTLVLIDPAGTVLEKLLVTVGG